VGFEATTPRAPKKSKGLTNSYYLIKDEDDKVERFKGEDFTTVGKCIQHW
jgi:hypothetical protein